RDPRRRRRAAHGPSPRSSEARASRGDGLLHRARSGTRVSPSGNAAAIIPGVGELRLTELGDRYNAAETYVDVHRAERPDRIAIRCQGASVTYGEMARNVDRSEERRVGKEGRSGWSPDDDKQKVEAAEGSGRRRGA